MDNWFSMIWGDVVGRFNGPLSARLFLQPAVAIVLGVLAGLKDARTGQPLFGWALFTDPAHRGQLLRSGWKDLSKVYVLAVALDCAYQYLSAGRIHPLEAAVVALQLAFLPYLLVRGPVNFLMRPRGGAARRPVE